MTRSKDYRLDSRHYCGQREWYSEVHDSYYCMKCDVWTEEQCGDKKCSYCVGRPPRPSES